MNWKSLCLLLVVSGFGLAGAAQVVTADTGTRARSREHRTGATGNGEFIEQFDTREYRDPDNTTAFWGAGVLTFSEPDYKTAQSLKIADIDTSIVRVRFAAEQDEGIRWEFTADGGQHWQQIDVEYPEWVEIANRGTDLRWRASRRDDATGNNRCWWLKLEWHDDAEPPPPPPPPQPRTWYIKADGTGDAPTIQAAIDSSIRGDTLLLAPGTYRGVGNCNITTLHAVTVMSEKGAEHTILDGQGVSFGFRIGWARTKSQQHSNLAHKSKSDLVSAPDWSFIGLTLENFSAAIDPLEAYVTVFDCVVRNCDVGLEGYGYAGFYADNCLLEGNVRAVSTSGLQMTSCVVRNNGIGLSFVGGTVEDCEILNNDVGVDGGYDGANVHLLHNRIVGNGRHGPGLVSYRGSVSLWWCQGSIIGNTILSNSGGALEIGEAVFRDVRDNIIAGNSSTSWGVIVCSGGLWPSVLRMENNTIVGNSAPNGPVISTNERNTVELAGNIIAFNVGNDLFYCAEGPCNPIILAGNDVFQNDGDATANVSDGGGNFSADPMFCNRFDGIFTLEEGSPCLPGNSPTGELVGALGQGCVAEWRELTFHPGKINLKGNKRTIKAVLEGEGVGTIDPETVRLNGVVQPEVSVQTIGSNKPSDDKAKRLSFDFAVADLVPTLTPGEELQTITLTAQLRDGPPVRTSAQLEVTALPPAGVETVESEAAAPIRPGIHSVTPNPFNPVTRIRYGLTQTGPVRLVIYDVAGRVAANPFEATVPMGEHEITWDAGAVPSGVYFAVLATPDGAFTRKLVVVK